MTNIVASGANAYTTFTGEVVLSFNIDKKNEGTVYSILSELEAGTLVDLTIKKHRKRRSLDANAYAWVLLDRLAVKLRRPKEEIYRELIRDVGGNSETVCVQNKGVDRLISGWKRNGIGWVADTEPSKLEGCTNVTLYYGSSTYDTEQMARLIDMIVMSCKEQGIETRSEEDINSLLEGWGK